MLKVNDANVICGGVHTANATVYLIDSVLMPPASNLPHPSPEAAVRARPLLHVPARPAIASSVIALARRVA